jgi:hypothetical protein
MIFDKIHEQRGGAKHVPWVIWAIIVTYRVEKKYNICIKGGEDSPYNPYLSDIIPGAKLYTNDQDYISRLVVGGECSIFAFKYIIWDDPGFRGFSFKWSLEPGMRQHSIETQQDIKHIR